MAQVDPDDDALTRYVVYHYRFDPERRERRNIVVAAYDSSEEMVADIDRRAEDLRAGRDAGESDEREQLSGVVWPPGHSHRMREQRQASRAAIAKGRAQQH